jgi:signal transduction histidine kinase
MPGMNRFARHWLSTLTRASPAYWIIQALLALGAVMTGAMMLEQVADGSGRPPAGFLLRSSLDALLLFLITHVGIRPLLRLRFAQRNPGTRAWLGLALWLMLMALVSIGLGLLIDHLGLTAASAITAVRFQAGDEELGFALSGGPLYAIAWLNITITYAIWTGLYLGWQFMQQRRRLQQEVREARLQQLTHQLNPHFLFNAFNTIRGTIFEDAQRAADLLTQLSELFRFHLGHAQRITHSLDEEWVLAQRYLAIEQARLEHRLVVSVELDPECLGCVLPSLALLVLIENAIKHGIAPDPAGGELRVRAQGHDRHWSLEVENPRRTMASRHGTGTGLSNLRERLTLGFGPDARMLVDESERGFRVRLELPWPNRTGDGTSTARAAMPDSGKVD